MLTTMLSVTSVMEDPMTACRMHDTVAAYEFAYSDLDSYFGSIDGCGFGLG